MFFLPYSKEGWASRLLDTEKPALADGGFIYDMIVPLTQTEARERYERLFPGENFATAMGTGTDFPDSHLFTCRHWDEQTGLCGVYEQRPGMCRDYPYGATCGGCDYQVSTEVAARHGRAWSWKGWRWRRGRYVAPRGWEPADGWEPRSWIWDAKRRTLTPNGSSESRWDPRVRDWVPA